MGGLCAWAGARVFALVGVVRRRLVGAAVLPDRLATGIAGHRGAAAPAGRAAVEQGGDTAGAGALVLGRASGRGLLRGWRGRLQAGLRQAGDAVRLYTTGQR